MVEVKKGEVYTAATVRQGTSSSGAWALVKVKNKRDSISIWSSTGTTDITEGGSFRITEILAVKQNKREFRGEWVTEVNVTAKLEKCESFTEFTGDFGENPFAEMGVTDELPL